MAVTVGLLMLGAVAARETSAAPPALPAVLLDTTLVPPTGSTINVPAGGSLQNALNSAVPGDVITLAPGATYTGTFTLPKKTGTGWIIVRSGAPDSALPAPGQRAIPSDAANMPKIVGPAGDAAIATANGAHHFRFIGIEFKPAGGTYSSGLIRLGNDDTSSTTLPSDIIFDRCYIHGDPTRGGRRGIAMNGKRIAVIDSHVSDWKGVGEDTQALVAWNGPGPFKIVNNYLEGAGENVMFGGGDPYITNLVPSDIEFRQNHVAKNPAWKTQGWSVKNLFELKNAKRVLIDGNLFEYNWEESQSGFSILFTVRNQDGTAPWSAVQDITFTNNYVRNVAAGVNILGTDDSQLSQPVERVLIQNNVFTNVNPSQYGGLGILLQILHGPRYVTFNHNTAFQLGSIIMADSGPASNFVFTNNIVRHNEYGVVGTGTGIGLPTLNAYFPGAVFQANALIGGDAGYYPAGNFFPTSVSSVGFVDYAGGDYALAPTSAYANRGTDGKDLGVDMNALAAAMAGTGTGGGGDGGGDTDTIAPTVAMSAPAASATVSGTVTLKATASDNVGVVGVQFYVNGAKRGAEDTTAAYTASWDTTTVANGTYSLNAVARDAAGNQTTSGVITVTVQNGATSTGTTQAVVWVDVRNVTVKSNTVRKSAGCDGCPDAGAGSAQTIASGDGWIQFTATTGPLGYFGFAKGTTKYNGNYLPFSLSFQGSYIGVYESGTYRADVPYVTGDIFRISIESGVVKYKKNGVVFYRSRVAPTYPLRANAVLYNTGAKVGNAKIRGSATTASIEPTVQNVAWTNVSNVTVADNTLTKSGGCDGCPDARARSVQRITGGSGYLEFEVPRVSGLAYVGLTDADVTSDGNALPIALSVDGRYAGVYESGRWRADVAINPGDVLRIAVRDGIVRYRKNGILFYRGTASAEFPLRAAAVLYDLGTKVLRAVMRAD